MHFVWLVHEQFLKCFGSQDRTDRNKREAPTKDAKNVLPSDLVKSQSYEILCWNDRINHTAAKTSGKFHSCCTSLKPYPSAVLRMVYHDDVIKRKHFPRYWSFMRGIHRLPVNSPPKGQWREALMLSLICAWINAWVNNREAGDLKRHRAHYDVTVMDCMGLVL